MPCKLSVVIGTVDRLAMLQPCIESARRSVGSLTYEIIVVDGGSTDGTADYLVEQPDVKTLWQGQRAGAVKAFNAGFRIATGEYVAALNDDCLVIGDTLARAAGLLDSRPKIGQVAIPFSDPLHGAAVDYVTVGKSSRSYLYANFGVIRRELGEALGWWGNDLVHYGGDTELSLRVWKAGYTVSPLPGGLIEHFRAQDDIRMANTLTHADFSSRWSTWDGRPNAPR